ncbi:MAG: undecaprenyl/decaprenyl-phosphate alpha-N-acetylglucosaminyl 1-phosphate transferase [Deltaproteobacteria bacterium]|nr:undecaprenyl/decaprenyl-phosphate alpha-N-acetylglucosaminyl 1-phosphate transferase [Deltaproteobacteria bacterium]
MDLTLDLGAARYPTAFILALVLSLYFTPIIRRAAISYSVVDRPDTSLKQHPEPTPYLGGVAIFLSFLFALAFTYDFTHQVLGILLAASIIVTLGLFDDLKVLTPGVKLAGQIVAAFVAAKAGVMIKLTFIPDWAALVLSLVWLVGMTNAINLIDVSDGLAAGVASIGGMFLYIIALQSGADTIAMLILALVGATLGFLAYNRPPARIFMGDTGSMLLGFMLGALAMIGHYTFRHRLGAVAPIVILGVPIFDTAFVMGARAVRRIPLMRGSPDHFAVRLRNRGMSASRIAVLGYLSAAVLGLAGLAICWVAIEVAAVIVGVVAAVNVLAAIVLGRMGRGLPPGTREG